MPREELSGARRPREMRSVVNLVPREVSILKGVDHPNVVRLLEVAHGGDDVALVYVPVFATRLCRRRGEVSPGD